MSHICDYCSRPCRPTDVDLGFISDLYKCDYHGAIIVLYAYQNSKHCYTQFRIKHKDAEYRITLVVADGSTRGFNFRIRGPAREVIFESDAKPNITPENAKEKLLTYLTFL